MAPRPRTSGFLAPPWGMIADDLTGACDAGVAFTRRGFRTAVLPAGLPEEIGGVEVAVVPTFSRDDPASEARRKVEAARDALAKRGIHVIYKKIDSTLKGNLAAEIDALLRGGLFPSAVVSPAFPAMGRTFVDGVLHVGGQPTGLHLPSLLAEAPGAQVRDANSDRDLRELAVAAVEGGALCAGSGGLAAQLAAVLAEQLGRAPSARKFPGGHGPALFVLGSEQSVTRTQLDYLLRNRKARSLSVHEVDTASAEGIFREGCHLAVPVDLASAGQGDADRLLAAAAQHLKAGLVASGGDTAEWVCRAGSVRMIELHGEVIAGIPWGEAVTASGERWRLITKAGGFGAEDALAAVADFFSKESDKSAP